MFWLYRVAAVRWGQRSKVQCLHLSCHSRTAGWENEGRGGSRARGKGKLKRRYYYLYFININSNVAQIFCGTNSHHNIRYHTKLQHSITLYTKIVGLCGWEGFHSLWSNDPSLPSVESGILLTRGIYLAWSTFNKLRHLLSAREGCQWHLPLGTIDRWQVAVNEIEKDVSRYLKCHLAAWEDSKGDRNK